MSTTTINITLPTQLKKQVEKQVKTNMYASISEYIRSAIRSMLASPAIPSEQLSPRAIKKYNKTLNDIKSGKEPIYTAENVKDLLDQLYGRKPPVQQKIS